MKNMLKLIFGSLLFLSILPASAQLITWVQPPTMETNLTSTLSATQVLEMISMVTDGSTAIDVTVNGQTMRFGGGGGRLTSPLPFVVAGPATLVIRRTSSGGDGGFFTFRISNKEEVAAGR